jgi:hypothetical protein
LAVRNRLQRGLAGGDGGACGRRISRASRENHHYRVIQSLELTVGKDSKFIGVFDAFRKKRNVSSYDIGGGISHREVEEMIGIAQSLQQDVEQWIRTNHASLL